jgi:hypothetical protein
MSDKGRIAVTVSLQGPLLKRAKERARRLGFPTFSAYVSWALENDVTHKPDLVFREEPEPYGTKGKG